MLKEMGLLGIGRLALALILFMGPGYGIFRFFPDRKKFDKTHIFLLSFVLSASFWALLLAWLQPTGVRLSLFPVAAIALVGWGIGIVRHLRTEVLWPVRVSFGGSVERILLWALLAGVMLVGLWAIRNQVVGSGSDSYHHTLIGQLIMEQGRLLDNYQPITDKIITFTYHFGFHVIVAVFGWLTGLPTHWIVLVLGILWIAFAALSSAFLTEIATGSRWGGLMAAVVTGVLCVFPTHMLTWGRYPQLAGLIVMGVFLGLLKQSLEAKLIYRRAAILGFLAAGLGCIHYRASLLTMVGAGTLIVSMWISGSLRKSSIKGVGLHLIQIGGVTLFLFLPWILHVVTSQTRGYSLVVPSFDPVYFSFMRIGLFAVNYPTNFLLLGMFAISIIWGLLRKDQSILWITLWTGACLILAQPFFKGVFMDFVSTLISGFFPIAVGIGWMAAEVARTGTQKLVWGNRLYFFLAVVVTFWFTPSYFHNVRSGIAYVQPDDLQAIEWVKNNTQPSANFMVNLYHFEFSPDLIIALDAGYWLPLLGERRTVSLPMSFMSEKFRTPDGIKALKELDALNGHLCRPEAGTLLAREGVTHVFIGSVGGPIAANELLNCPNFSLEFQHQSTYVFRFTKGLDQ